MTEKSLSNLSGAKSILDQIQKKTDRLQTLRLDIALGKQKNTSLIKKYKREIAQLHSEINRFIFESANPKSKL